MICMFSFYSSKPTGLELQKTIAWLRANFLEDYAVAIPKEDVYFLYTTQALRDGLKPVSTADFGKLVRQVFPEVMTIVFAEIRWVINNN